jgi:hypothetical protein
MSGGNYSLFSSMAWYERFIWYHCHGGSWHEAMPELSCGYQITHAGWTLIMFTWLALFALVMVYLFVRRWWNAQRLQLRYPNLTSRQAGHLWMNTTAEQWHALMTGTKHLDTIAAAVDRFEILRSQISPLLMGAADLRILAEHVRPEYVHQVRSFSLAYTMLRLIEQERARRYLNDVDSIV